MPKDRRVEQWTNQNLADCLTAVLDRLKALRGLIPGPQAELFADMGDSWRPYLRSELLMLSGILEAQSDRLAPIHGEILPNGDQADAGKPI